MDIDAVILFVDHADVHWNAEKEISKAHFFDETIHNHDSNLSCRYVSVCDEIIYALKAISNHASWIRTVFIVMATFHCLPLHQLHPRAKIILHNQIMPPEALPTYSSNAIENSLHRIPGLSQEFIVFNDDVILVKPVLPQDFFNANRFPLYLFDQGFTKTGVPEVAEYGYRSMWKNSNRFLDEYFPHTAATNRHPTLPRKKLSHSPFPMTKSLLEHLWTIPSLTPMLQITQNAHFRSIHDVNLICAIAPYFALYCNKAAVGHLRSKTLYLNDNVEEAVNAMAQAEAYQPHIICIESTMTVTNPSLTWLCHAFVDRVMQLGE